MNRATAFRPFRAEDYAALADLLTRLRPAEPVSEEHLRRFDAERTAAEHHARTLAWTGAELTGLVETERSRSFTRPGWYGLHVHAADPDLRAALLELGLNALQPLSPTTLHTTLSERAAEYGWLTRLGWREHERMWISELDLTTFTPDAFAERRARAQAAGITVAPLTQLGWDGSEAMQRRLYDLTIGLLSDVPSTDPVIPWPFEVWRGRILQHPDFTPDGPLVAVQQGEWVGLTELYRPRHEVAGQLHQGLTGVRREWRGQGVAWALKLTAAARARAQGWQSVRTGNHTVNREMLGINRAMGFVRGPARVVLVREWKEADRLSLGPTDAPPSGG